MKNTAIIQVNRDTKTISVGFSLTGSGQSGSWPLTREGVADLRSEIAIDDLCDPSQNSLGDLTMDALSCLDELELDLGDPNWND